MKKWVLMTALMFGSVALSGIPSWAYDFGDFRSATLTTKAWGALGEKDIEAVLAYTNKCIDLYGEQAKTMQEDLSEFPAGSNDEIFSFWALNDVATCLYIQGQAFEKAAMKDEAKEAYQRLVEDFTYGQAWDTKGWFWKPADAAKDRVNVLEGGVAMDFGDMSSSDLTAKSWEALKASDLEAVLAFTGKCLDMFGEKAKEMQDSLTEYPWGGKDKVFQYWALNDVGTCLYIQGEAYKKAGEVDGAREAYNKLINEYGFAQCWDTSGWFWKPAEAAQQAVESLE